METNQIIQGDCLEVMKDIPDKSVDMVLTSPPYNRKRNDKYTYYEDIKDNWFEFNCSVIDKLLVLTKKHIFYNLQANYYNREDVYRLIGKYHKQIRDIHIWEKSNPMPASGTSITNAVEYFIILGNEPLKSNTTYNKNIITTSVNSSMPKDLKAVMKYEVAEHFLSRFSTEGGIVLDPFAGSGTTGVACQNLNRNYILIEKEPEYIKIINDRLGLSDSFA